MHLVLDNYVLLDDELGEFIISMKNMREILDKALLKILDRKRIILIEKEQSLLSACLLNRLKERFSELFINNKIRILQFMLIKPKYL